MVVQLTLEHPSSKDAGEGDSLSRIATSAQYQQDPAGGFCPIGVQQLCMAWWLYQNKHLTRRQFRLYFACHEIAARRPKKRSKSTKQVYRGGDFGYRPTEGSEKAHFPALEALKLLGEQVGDKAASAVRSDFRRLCRLGLIDDSGPRFKFAKTFAPPGSPGSSLSQDDFEDFLVFFDAMPNRRRTVPVPRRTLRALAGGFTRAVTGVMLAYLIRSLHWQKHENRYRIDGRTKGSWIAEIFRLSRKSVTEGRKRLIELGWIRPLEVTQWEMNKWGWHDLLDPNLSFSSPPEDSQGSEGASDEDSEASGAGAGETPGITSPQGDSAPVFTSPIKERKKNLLQEELKNRTPGNREAASGQEDSVVLILGDSNSSHPSSGAGRGVKPPPNLNDIQPEDFQSTARMLSLHRQACERSLADSSEAGRLDFLALCEKALAIGEDPCRMLAWLLKKQRYAWISQSDEDRAAERLRQLRKPDLWPTCASEKSGSSPQFERETSLDELESPALSEAQAVIVQQVKACLVQSKRYRLSAFDVARRVFSWTKAQWDENHEIYAESTSIQ